MKVLFLSGGVWLGLWGEGTVTVDVHKLAREGSEERHRERETKLSPGFDQHMSNVLA